MAATIYIVKDTVDIDGKRYAAGDKPKLELRPEQEGRLVELGVIELPPKTKTEPKDNGDGGAKTGDK
ncbi:hypothetical protein [Methylomicrobium sp. Wu6]|uniref:hypothetical protein n=1 Tax=Methylomicrobium sp. Wu6 TaxID=3107928 RepID=UPI002DD69301|nr:hypothetical protein [Methylomicrobium sp. Wu6]MEC4750046.1 hypothetical protein [Methylomicrobium sp. Wu6]